MCFQVASKAVATILGGQLVPTDEIYRARKAVFDNLANVVECLNTCFVSVH